MMNALRFMLATAVVGSALVFAGCGKPAVEHTDDDGHDHSKHAEKEDHSGHNH